jgi:hypothetical protein
MVYGYNVSYKTGQDYYKKEVKDSLKNIDELDINLKTTLLIFSLYFSFLNKMFKENDFFKVSLKDLIEKHKEKLLKEGEIILSICDNSKVNFSYFVPIYWELDRIYKKKRTRAKFTYISTEIDKNKTMRALTANLTHSIDAVYVRYILLNLETPIITIHDCFGIDILNVNTLIEIANYSINKIHYSVDVGVNIKTNSNYYSKYILI